MIDTPRLTPDLGGTISGALSDTWPALRSWLPWLVAVVVVICAGAALIFASGFFQAAATKPPGRVAHIEYYIAGESVLIVAIVVGATFALASAVRTIKPEFSMTAGTFFGFFGYGLLSALIIMVGFICLVIPGFYLAIKFSAVPYVYLLGEREPLKTSWKITKGRFWWTVLVVLLIGLCAQVGIYAVAIVGALISLIPFAIFALVPVFVAVLFAVYQFEYNAFMRWFDTLLKTA